MLSKFAERVNIIDDDSEENADTTVVVLLPIIIMANQSNVEIIIVFISYNLTFMLILDLIFFVAIYAVIVTISTYLFCDTKLVNYGIYETSN